LCSSAAEEEEYEAFRLTRQPRLFLPLSLP
jgi:hypothetical protein